MDSAATPSKPKRSRAAKPKVEATVVASITHRERMAAVDARAAETRKRVEADYAENGYGPMPRTSYRWIGRRTKGLPYSRMVVKNVIPGMHGTPGVIVVRHPTKRRGLKVLPANATMLEIFMPSLPGSLTAAMLGTN